MHLRNPFADVADADAPIAPSRPLDAEEAPGRLPDYPAHIRARIDAYETADPTDEFGDGVTEIEVGHQAECSAVSCADEDCTVLECDADDDCDCEPLIRMRFHGTDPGAHEPGPWREVG